MEQLRLLLSKKRRGGARVGAGRKPLPAKLRHTPHRARPKHQVGHPVHVTLRPSVRSLRSEHVVRTVLSALRDSNRGAFRIAHYSVQDNHLHLIVEAENKTQLSSRVRGIMIRVARRVNRLLFRRGRFWADRWHGHALTGPRQVRNALVYVLQNHRKHRISGKGVAAQTLLDTLSSAQWFNGFSAPLPRGFRSVGPPSAIGPDGAARRDAQRAVVPATTWLLTKGWLRRGLIRFTESPKSER